MEDKGYFTKFICMSSLWHQFPISSDYGLFLILVGEYFPPPSEKESLWFVNCTKRQTDSSSEGTVSQMFLD